MVVGIGCLRLVDEFSDLVGRETEVRRSDLCVYSRHCAESVIVKL